MHSHFKTERGRCRLIISHILRCVDKARTYNDSKLRAVDRKYGQITTNYDNYEQIKR